MEAKVIPDTIIEKKIEIIYPKGRRITTKRFPTDYEIKERKIPRSKLIEVSEITSHNELEVKLYNIKEHDSVKIITGGLMDINEKTLPGAYIVIKTKGADKELTQDINDIVRNLCKKYLKSCICYPGRYTTQAKVDNCLFTEQIGFTYYEEFKNEIMKKVEHYQLQKIEETKQLNEGYITYKPKSFWKKLFGK